MPESIKNLVTGKEEKKHESVDSTALKQDKPMERKLAGSMEEFVYSTLASLKKAQTEAISAEAEYIAYLAGFELSYKNKCGEMTKSFPAIEPVTSSLAFDANGRYPSKCMSFVQNKKIDSIKNLTEKIVNCPECAKEFLAYANSLRYYNTKK